MTLRKWIKRWVYEFCPGFRGRFPYFRTNIYFPRGSMAFREACRQGIFESENVRVLQAMTLPDTWMFDVGANIGLMSAPVLQFQPRARVLAFEPSPNVLPYLRQSIRESLFTERWVLVEKAVGAKLGKVSFSLSSRANAMFDSIRPTNRVPTVGQIEVEMTTIDIEWRSLGEPHVSVIKCDVEGAELDVLCGAKDCLRSQKPAILLEWNAANLKAYDYSAGLLLDFCRDSGYRLFSIPGLGEIMEVRLLKLHMLFTESFLMLANNRES